MRFTPFDPATKTSEALIADGQGNEQRIVKGAPAAIASIAPFGPSVTAELDTLTRQGYRVLAVAGGPPQQLTLMGLVALSDPPRPDSKALLAELRSMGVHTVMVTGDAAPTAATVAAAIGLEGPVCPPGAIPDSVGPEDFAVYAGVFPEDKFRLVKAFQRKGHTVGMCGDGANDAPALRQAQMGIAVSTATDVAKSAASMVLTEPGLEGIVTAIKEGRSAFQRILTYTLNALVKKFQLVLFLGAGLIMTGHAILTPMLMALLLITGDFITMSLTTDRATPSPMPDAWRIRTITAAAAILGLFGLTFAVGVIAAGKYVLGFRYRRAADPRFRHARLREPGDDLCRPRPQAHVAFPPWGLAVAVFLAGSWYRRLPGDHRHPHGATTRFDGCGSTRGSDGVLSGLGRGQACSVHAPQNRLTA